jgi:hypothetical protein
MGRVYSKEEGVKTRKNDAQVGKKKKKKTQSSQSALVFKSQGKDAGERGQIWKGV